MGVAHAASAQAITSSAGTPSISARSSTTTTAVEPTWEIEARGGLGLYDFNWGLGSGHSLFFNGDLQSLSPVRLDSVSSWFFGIGNEYINAAVQNQIPGSLGVTPLYTTLLQQASYRKDPTIGFDVSRRLTARFALELSLDVGTARESLGGGAASAVAASTSSYASTFNALFASAPTLFTGASVTAVSTFHNGGRPLVATGALAIRFDPRGHIRPFLLLGAGVERVPGPPPAVTLVGHYAFTFTPSGPQTTQSDQGYPVAIDETDRVTVQYGTSGTRPVGVVGLGFTRDLSARSSIRLEGRAIIGGGDPVTLSATPTHVTGSPTGTLDYPSFFALQFSTSPRFQSSLSMPVSGLEPYSGSGGRIQVVVSAGYVVRLGLAPQPALAPHVAGPPHRFMDRREVTLLGVATSALLVDGASTQALRRLAPGTPELDPLARWFVNRGWPGQIAGGALLLSGEIGLQYLFHRTGHHELERALLVIQAAANGTAAASNLIGIHEAHTLGNSQ